jgi:L-lactate dehydrogenase complex protein LldG
MSARDQILGQIGRSLGRAPLAESAKAEAAARIHAHRRNLVPARAQKPAAERIDLFVHWAQFHMVSVDRVPGAGAVPNAVANYLTQHNLGSEIRMATHPDLERLPWDLRPLLTIRRGPAEMSDQVSVTSAFAGIAETGTLVLHSGPQTPTTLNLVPETHIVVLRTGQVVGTYEDMWDRLRARFGTGVMPRTVNFITGPSRTADIEQKMILGAHGPRRLHIVLVDDGAA